MSWDVNWDIVKKEQDKQQKERLRRIRSDVRLAKATGSTVPYSIRDLMDAGIGIDTIRRVLRS